MFRSKLNKILRANTHSFLRHDRFASLEKGESEAYGVVALYDEKSRL
jgi:hypothetical protein